MKAVAAIFDDCVFDDDLNKNRAFRAAYGRVVPSLACLLTSPSAETVGIKAASVTPIAFAMRRHCCVQPSGLADLLTGDASPPQKIQAKKSAGA